MKRQKDTASEETKLNEDIDIFEEWEESGEEEKAPAKARKPGKSAAPADEANESPESISLDEDFGGVDGEGGGIIEEVSAAPAAARAAAFEEAAAAGPADEPVAAASLADELMEMAPDIPVNLAAVIGKTTTNVGDLMKCRIGQVIDLGRPPGETVDLVANGRLIARGELVEMDGKLGVRILKLVK